MQILIDAHGESRVRLNTRERDTLKRARRIIDRLRVNLPADDLAALLAELGEDAQESARAFSAAGKAERRDEPLLFGDVDGDEKPTGEEQSPSVDSKTGIEMVGEEQPVTA